MTQHFPSHLVHATMDSLIQKTKKHENYYEIVRRDSEQQRKRNRSEIEHTHTHTFILVTDRLPTDLVR